VRGARAVGVAALTRREREVLEMLGRGRNHAEVAVELQISRETARTHAKRVYRKLGVSSRGELVGVEV
jgi:DNA-binding CsgD family transcriptional regulator